MWRKRKASSSGEARAIRADHVLADQRGQTPVHERYERLGRQRAHHLAMEDRALHGDAREQRALLLRQALEPGCEQRMDRGRHGQLGRLVREHPALVLASKQPVVDQHREQLLGEERVALAGIGDARGRLVRRAGVTEQVLHELPGLVRAERLQEDRCGVQLPATPAGTRLEQLGPRRAQQDHRRVARRSATCSTRSRKVGSAHWRSSITITSGRSRASASNRRRAAQKISSLVTPAEPPRPTRIRQHGGDQLGLRVVGEPSGDGLAGALLRVRPRPRRSDLGRPPRAAST